jgi:hypothetical protein
VNLARRRNAWVAQTGSLESEIVPYRAAAELEPFFLEQLAIADRGLWI